MIFLFWAVVALAACVAQVSAAGDSYQPRYYKPLPRPLSVKYITANAEESAKKRTGDKSAPFAIEDLMDASAFNKSLPGTVFLLSGGAYKLGARLVLPAHLSGNETNPVALIADLGDRATIYGKVEIAADHFWLMGVEITDPMHTEKLSSAIQLTGANVRVINCFVHDVASGNGIFSPSSPNPKNHVIYGNVLSRTGLISSRVDATATDGIRIANSMGNVYVADNVVVGYDKVCDKCRGFGGATDPTSVAELATESTSRVLLEGNMFAQSQLTIGAYGAPSQENIVHNNWFGESELQVGQAAPTQTEVTDNVVVWAYLDSRYVWGDGDAAYGSAPKPTIIRGNTVFFAPVDGDIGRENDLPALDLGTAAYAFADDKTRVGARPELGKAPLPASLVVNSNTYGGPSTFFRLNAGGVMSTLNTLDEWRNATRSAGKECDTSSSLVTPPNNTVQVMVRQNLYSPYRAHALIFNYGTAGNATIPLVVFAAIRMPQKFAVFRASEQWSGQPVAEGILPSSEVNVTLNATQRVSAFVIVANDGKDPAFPPRCVDPNAPGCDPCPRFDEGCVDGPCREGECLTTTLECNKNGYCEEIKKNNGVAGGATAEEMLMVGAMTMIAMTLNEV